MLIFRKEESIYKFNIKLLFSFAEIIFLNNEELLVIFF